MREFLLGRDEKPRGHLLQVVGQSAALRGGGFWMLELESGALRNLWLNLSLRDPARPLKGRGRL